MPDNLDLTNTETITLGNEGAVGTPYQGAIDEVRVYNYALASGEVKELYDSAQGLYLTGECNDLSGSIHPGVPDICGDAIDNNCDGLIDRKANGIQCTICDHYQLTVPVSECTALMDLYTGTNGANRTNNSGRLSNPNVDQWFGIQTTTVN